MRKPVFGFQINMVEAGLNEHLRWLVTWNLDLLGRGIVRVCGSSRKQVHDQRTNGPVNAHLSIGADEALGPFFFFSE